MFSTSERWEPERSQVPGPGAYEPQDHNWDRADAGAAFRATAERFGKQGMCQRP